ncbi:MAG: RluA family pseudouridine synthase [Candidatus Omnitrophica bacterium]|nr:RluA family pseudouridine synthase [Candidatus Omnitrophota bacterium]
MEKFYLKVAGQDIGLRIDQYIIKHLRQSISRSRIQRLIDSGEITVNQEPTKARYKVKENDRLAINIPAPAKPNLLAENIPLDIVFEDDDILIINKPKDMVTHPAAGNYSHTLVNALLNYGCALSTVNGPLRPGIVHRLDKDTTGLMAIAKNDFAHQGLARQFRKHTVKRKYIAIVKGKMAHNEGVIDYPLARDPHNRQKMAVSFLKKSRHALTRYKVLKRYKELTLVELEPHTGRTHQLRVHLKFCGHPILGDTRYGRASSLNRMALHATGLGFKHPRTGKSVQFQSDTPKCVKDFLKSAKQ